jgi:hypothetical protein
MSKDYKGNYTAPQVLAGNSRTTPMQNGLKTIDSGMLAKIPSDGIVLEVNQIPSEDNQHTAICTYTACRRNTCISAFGVATPATNEGKADAVELLDLAVDQALSRVLKQRWLLAEGEILDIALDNEPTTSPPQLEVPHYNHSSAKGMSYKQEKWIAKLAAQKRVNAQDFMKKTIGFSNDLTSADANAVIQALQSL